MTQILCERLAVLVLLSHSTDWVIWLFFIT
jgi:hypothetical protein